MRVALVRSGFPFSGYKNLRRSLDKLAKSFGNLGFPCAEGAGVNGGDGKQEGWQVSRCFLDCFLFHINIYRFGL